MYFLCHDTMTGRPVVVVVVVVQGIFSSSTYEVFLGKNGDCRSG
jgi:hypothetical protein